MFLMCVLRTLVKFFRLPQNDRRILVKAMFLVWGVRLTLWLFPFRLLRALLARFSGAPTGYKSVKQMPIEKVVWAVTVVSRYVPFATCLTQALSTKFLLSRFGHDAHVCIGVARSDTGKFEAHAWLESGGRVVIGGSEASLQRYTPLTASNGELW
jgi:hypothetical protein